MKIGVTGHQRLDDPTSWDWVEKAMNAELHLCARPLTAVTSLAIGADRLLARLVESRGGQIYAVIPFRGYERTFDLTQANEYQEFLSRAAFVEVLQTPGTDEDAYLAAGKRVVELADLMITVWDGEPAKGRGGTADIVAFAEKRHVPLIHINPAEKSVLRLDK